MSKLENYKEVLKQIDGARAEFGLPEADQKPQLIVVTKTHGAEQVRPLLEAGHRHFGENRVQELQEKWPKLLEEFPDVCLHLIGPLQSNKVKPALELCTVIHTLDRPSLLEALVKHAQPHHRVLIQINTGHEEQKAGVTPLEAPKFITQAKEALQEKLCGLMCIPPVDENPAPHFGLLKLLGQQHNLPELSMGMSGDYALAAALGATYVRVGSAIFGERA